jgi:hypothetical protein
MAKQLTEQELRQQAVRGIERQFRAQWMRYGSLHWFLVSPLTTNSGGRSIFRTTAWMNYSRKFETTTAGSIPKRRANHYFCFSSA